MSGIPFTSVAHTRRGVRDLFERVLSTESSDPVAEGGIAALRLLTGALVASLHGWHKVVQGWHYVASGSDWPLLDDSVQLGFPAPAVFAAAAALSQFAGGWLLAVGAFTRPAAVLVAGTMLTAMSFNLQFGGPDAQLAGLYALIAGAFTLSGGGVWSVDRRITEHRLRTVSNLNAEDRSS